jgi:hypothetical protein
VKAEVIRYAMRRVGIGRFAGSWWSHAFIGVKGARSGTASERTASRIDLAVGALKVNLAADSLASDVLLLEALQRRAAVAPAGFAVHVPAWTAKARLTVVRVE